MNTTKLKNVCVVVSGSTPKSTDKRYWNGTHVWITPAELSEDSFIVTDSERHITDEAIKATGLKSFPKGTVLLSSRAPIGKVAIAGCEMYCNQGFKNLICSESIYNLYLYYFLKSKTAYLNSLGRGATFKEISKGIVEDISIPFPVYSEQIRIAKQLQKISELISLKKEQYRYFDDIIRSRFIEMFGHSDRPKVRLGECCIINPKKSSDIRLVDNDLMVSFVSMSDVSEDGQIVTCNHKQYESVKSGFTYFSENDVLFAKITPCMENGKGGIAKGLLNGIGFGSTEFHVLRPIDQVSNSCWLYELTSFPQFRQAAEINMTGSAGQRRVPASFLANYKVSLPPISLQNQFADFVHHLDKSKYREAIFLYLLEDIRICCNI